MRRVMALGVVLLLLPSASAGWSQLQGGPGHPGTLPPMSATLDVVDSFQLPLDPDLELKPGIRWTPQGLVALLGPPGNVVGESCTLVRFTHGAPVTELARWPCLLSVQELVAYVPGAGLLLICNGGASDSPVLSAWDAVSGERRWTMSPEDAGALPGMGPSVPGLAGDEQAVWFCDGAVDEAEGTAYMAFGSNGDNRLAVVDTQTGALLRARTIQAAELAGTALPDTQGAGGFFPTSVTLIPGAVLVTGAVSVNNVVNTLLWYDHDLNLLGYAGGRLDDPTEAGLTDANLRSSRWASSAGGTAVALLGGSVIWIDAETNRPVRRLTNDPGPGGAGAGSLGPIWAQGRVAVPISNTLTIYEGGTGEQLGGWSSAGWFLTSVVATADGDLLLMVDTNRQADVQVDLIRLDSASGREVHRLRLPLSAYGENQGLVPSWDSTGLLVVSGAGEVAALGPADPLRAPDVSISDEFPLSGVPISVAVEMPVSAESVLLHWGDGGSQRLDASGSVEHRYEENGRKTLRVTAYYDDGTTATASRTFDVGGIAPSELNWLQTRFAPGNQDMTWGVIGLIIVLISAAVGLAARRMGRSRIAAGLRELAGIRDSSSTQPLEALRELQAWHGIQEDRLLHGRLTEDQFRVLEDRGGRLMRSVTQRVLEPVTPALPAAFTRKLESAYRDGFVDPAEVDGLRNAATALRLPAAKKRALEGVLEAWA